MEVHERHVRACSDGGCHAQEDGCSCPTLQSGRAGAASLFVVLMVRDAGRCRQAEVRVSMDLSSMACA